MRLVSGGDIDKDMSDDSSIYRVINIIISSSSSTDDCYQTTSRKRGVTTPSLISTISGSDLTTPGFYHRCNVT